jgi:hypothetical protein
MPSDALAIMLVPLFPVEESRVRTCDALELNDHSGGRSRPDALEANPVTAGESPPPAHPPEAEQEHERGDRRGGGDP